MCCSAAVSVSFAVDIRFWASTTRQELPETRVLLDDSSSRVEIADDIRETRN